MVTNTQEFTQFYSTINAGAENAEADRAAPVAVGERGIADIIGREQLFRIQSPLTAQRGLHTAILTPTGEFICSGEPGQTGFNPEDFAHVRKVSICAARAVYGVWVIASDDKGLIEKNALAHDVLGESLSKLTNSYIMLYNEMKHTERANKLLSETIQQQILLNDIYTKVLNERNSPSTVRSVMELVGSSMGLSRVIICEDVPDDKKYKTVYNWAASRELGVGNEELGRGEFAYDDYPQLIEELSYYETYFSNNPGHDVLGLDFTSYVASNLNGDGAKYGIILYIINEPARSLSNADKRLLRSVSQIIAAVIMRCRDNEQLDNTNHRLHYLAYHDPVLGVKNKVSLGLDITDAIESGNPGGVVALTIPGIKDINNFVGHDRTDSLIVKVLKWTGDYEKLSVETYRFSDKVFMVLLRDADAVAVKEFCDAVTERFRLPWSVAGGEHYLESTAGAALFPNAGGTAEELCRKAIMAMYKAREYGANSYAFFSGEFEYAGLDDYHAAGTLRNAVENNMDGLAVKYMPVYDRDGVISSCEAIVALTAPAELQSYPPHIIMQIADKMGLDVTIDSWVIKQACRFSAKTGMKVSVTASARSLTTKAIVTMVNNALCQSGETPLPAERLGIQFSERVVAVNYDCFMAVLSELKKIGVPVILDNVGSYYATSNLLRHSGITAAKTDITLFTGKIDDFDGQYIERLFALARNNGVTVGVKSIDNAEQLALAGEADRYQGRYYCEAMSEEEFEGLLVK